MAHPPPYDCDISLTSISTNYISNNYTGGLSVRIISNNIVVVTTTYSQYCEPLIREIVETKKEKLDRVSKEKMLSSHKIYNQKTPQIIKIKQMCKPQHRISNGVFRGLR